MSLTFRKSVTFVSYEFPGRWLWKLPSSGMWRRVALLRTDVSEKRIITIKGLLTFQASLFFSTWWWGRYVPPKHWFLQEPCGVTFQKTAFFAMFLCTLLNKNYITFKFLIIHQPRQIWGLHWIVQKLLYHILGPLPWQMYVQILTDALYI
jgi:hypothetical protein